VGTLAIVDCTGVDEQEAVRAREFVLLFGLHGFGVAGRSDGLLRWGVPVFVFVFVFVVAGGDSILQDGVEVSFDVVVIFFVFVVAWGASRCGDVVVIVVIVVIVVVDVENVDAENVVVENVVVVKIVVENVVVENVVVFEVAVFGGFVVSHRTPEFEGGSGGA
jgi:hypothetical protein